ncbi:MAG: hypothetical protein AVDCRST_MAG08-3144, partial [uncultured Acetobacteraceae bacterium]
ETLARPPGRLGGRARGRAGLGEPAARRAAPRRRRRRPAPPRGRGRRALARARAGAARSGRALHRRAGRAAHGADRGALPVRAALAPGGAARHRAFPARLPHGRVDGAGARHRLLHGRRLRRRARRPARRRLGAAHPRHAAGRRAVAAAPARAAAARRRVDAGRLPTGPAGGAAGGHGLPR